MGLKHGSTPESKYIQIHKNVLKNFGIQKEYQITRLTNQYFTMHAEFTLTTKKGSKVDVKIHKDCLIDISKKLKDPPVSTFAYSYHARLKDGRNLLRYCSPDRDEGHRAHHHKHVYDSLGEELTSDRRLLEPDKHPHVNEFLEELYETY